MRGCYRRNVAAGPPAARIRTAPRKMAVDPSETRLHQLFRRRALGVEGTPLEDLALAGLLHDLGHLDPAGEHQDPEWRRANHNVLGAARLAPLDGIPDAAVLVALEHHRRLDGADADPSRRPSAVVRLMAVADTWVTLRGPGRAPVPVALAALRRPVARPGAGGAARPRGPGAGGPGPVSRRAPAPATGPPNGRSATRRKPCSDGVTSPWNGRSSAAVVKTTSPTTAAARAARARRFRAPRSESPRRGAASAPTRGSAPGRPRSHFKTPRAFGGR